MSRNLINFSDLAKKDIFDLIELANNFKSDDALDYRNENLFHRVNALMTKRFINPLLLFKVDLLLIVVYAGQPRHHGLEVLIQNSGIIGASIQCDGAEHSP